MLKRCLFTLPFTGLKEVKKNAVGEANLDRNQSGTCFPLETTRISKRVVQLDDVIVG